MRNRPARRCGSGISGRSCMIMTPGIPDIRTCQAYLWPDPRVHDHGPVLPEVRDRGGRRPGGLLQPVREPAAPAGTGRDDLPRLRVGTGRPGSGVLQPVRRPAPQGPQDPGGPAGRAGGCRCPGRDGRALPVLRRPPDRRYLCILQYLRETVRCRSRSCRCAGVPVPAAGVPARPGGCPAPCTCSPGGVPSCSRAGTGPGPAPASRSAR